MATINRADYVIQSQIIFGDFLDVWIGGHVRRERILAASTRAKYMSHAENHIRPTFGKLQLREVTTRLIEAWLDDKAKPPVNLSWATRTDLRNILSSVFTKAEDWGYWQAKNPVERVSVGRRLNVREKRKLTTEQQSHLLAMVPESVALMIETALFCSLRVSEILGIQEKDFDGNAKTLSLRQRFYRGDLDVTRKTKPRTLQVGDLAPRLALRLTGEPDAFLFRVETRPQWGRKSAVCRDDRDILQHFLRPAAKALGLYYPGFGFHAFRREAITDTADLIGVGQAMKLAGHSSANMTQLYTLDDQDRQADAVKIRQERLRGKVGRA